MGVITAFVALFVLFCPLIIRILTAGRYMPSTPYARVIAISTITSSLYYLVNDFTIAKGYPRLYLYTMILGSVGIVVMMPWAISRFRFAGGAWMVSISYLLLIVANLLMLLMLRRKRV